MRSVPLSLLLIVAAGILQPLKLADSVDLLPPYPNIITVNGMAQFLCVNHRSGRIGSVQWRINNELLSKLFLPSVMARIIDLDHKRFGELTLTMPPLSYNMYSVQCEATLEGSETPILSPTQILLIQGLLSFPDGSLILNEDNLGNVVLTWTPPPTLNVLNEPNTTYCVNVVNSTSSEMLHSECNITETVFFYDIPPMTWCHTYIFSVIPVNSVGKGEPATERFNDSRALIPPYLLSGAPMSTPHSTVAQTLNMSASVCSASVTCVDDDTGETFNGVVTIIQDVIEVTIQLKENRIYNATVMASNVAGPATSYITISTHEIEDVQIVRRDSGLEMSTTYSHGSSGKGALYCFIYVINDEDLDFTKSFCIPVSIRNYTLPYDRLHRGEYYVFVYDIEGDGNLQNGESYPARITNITSNSGQGSPSVPKPLHITQCTFTSPSGSKVIMSDCEFPLNSEATGIQILVQWQNISTLHILHTEKTANRQTSASVTVKDFGTYRVTVFAIRGERGIVDSNAEFTEEIKVEDSALINRLCTGTLVASVLIASVLLST